LSAEHQCCWNWKGVRPAANAFLLDTGSGLLAKHVLAEHSKWLDMNFLKGRLRGYGLTGIRENSRPAKTTKGKLNHEKSQYDIDGHPAGVGLLYVFARSASDL
jgi:hypothetical protein